MLTFPSIWAHARAALLGLTYLHAYAYQPYDTPWFASMEQIKDLQKSLLHKRSVRSTTPFRIALYRITIVSHR